MVCVGSTRKFIICLGLGVWLFGGLLCWFGGYMLGVGGI